MRLLKTLRAGMIGATLLISAVTYAQDRPSLYTVNYPLQYFAERIGGDVVDVVFPAPADEDPAYWIPTTDNVLGYQAADAILLNGADYAGWLNRVTLPPSKLVNTSNARADEYLAMGAGQVHSHGPGGEHEEHTGWAFTVWLDFDWAQSQAHVILNTLIAIAPESEELFRVNFTHLVQDLATLDSAASELGRRAAGRPLLGSHPVYQYLSDRYQLKLQSVHWEPDVLPSPTDWRDLNHELGRHKAKIMLWEAEPLSETKEQLARQGIESVVFDPSANTPTGGDLLEVMRDNLSRLEAALK